MKGDGAPHHGRPYAAEQITVYFEPGRCRHFAECVRGLPEVFDIDRKPWISPGGADAAQVAEVVRRCPSGALQYDGSGTRSEEPDVPTRVSVAPEGLIRLRGDLGWTTPNGTSTRETRLALCGCGRSQRRPHCDASCLNPAEAS